MRSFDEVRASPVTFAADPSDPSRAISRVTTTVPMICAIVWGETDEYGRFNNGLAMNGTGITQHDVVLPAVIPGTTYHYLVQGTTADGTLYRSEPATFTIDAPTGTTGTEVPTGASLLEGARVIDVSSEFSATFAAANAIDGDTATEWATKGDGDGATITIELAQPSEIGTVAFLTRSMADGTAVTTTFTVSVDDGPPLGPFPAGTVAQPRPATLQQRGQRLRFAVASSTGGNVGAVEIQINAPT